MAQVREIARAGVVAQRLQSTAAMEKHKKPNPAPRRAFRALSTDELRQVQGGEDAPPPPPPRDFASGQATGKRTHKPLV